MSEGFPFLLVVVASVLGSAAQSHDGGPAGTLVFGE
jgi:hypothetical protein